MRTLSLNTCGLNAAAELTELCAALLATSWQPVPAVSRFAPLVRQRKTRAAARAAILAAYEADPTCRDGLSRLAFLLWGEGVRNVALRLWREDLKLGRADWLMTLKYADALAESGKLRHAMATVEEVYAHHAAATGGFAGLGWRIRWSAPAMAKTLFAKDMELNRISPEYLAKYAFLLAQQGADADAVAMATLAYQRDPSQEKVFHQLAETSFIKGRWDSVLSIYGSAPFSNWFQTVEARKPLQDMPQERAMPCDNQHLLHAFYDFAGCAPTFNFALFLAHAEAYRKAQGLEGIVTVIVPASPLPFPAWYPLNQEAQRWRLWNILMPLCHLLPSWRGGMIASSRSEALHLERTLARNIFPPDYSTCRPTIDYNFLGRISGHHAPPCFTAPDAARALVNGVLTRKAAGRRVVTISLRETNTINKDRNSNLTDWLAFAESLDPDRYFPIVIRDQDKALATPPPRLKRHLHLPEAAWSLEFRTALYEASHANLGVNNGPMLLCLLTPLAKCLIFKMLSMVSDITTPAYLRTHAGLEPGAQSEFAAPQQRFVWSDDTFETILRAFTDMDDAISPPPPPLRADARHSHDNRRKRLVVKEKQHTSTVMENGVCTNRTQAQP